VEGRQASEPRNLHVEPVCIHSTRIKWGLTTTLKLIVWTKNEFEHKVSSSGLTIHLWLLGPASSYHLFPVQFESRAKNNLENLVSSVSMSLPSADDWQLPFISSQEEEERSRLHCIAFTAAATPLLTTPSRCYIWGEFSAWQLYLTGGWLLRLIASWRSRRRRRRNRYSTEYANTL
jgi:hypothetical protein